MKIQKPSATIKSQRACFLSGDGESRTRVQRKHQSAFYMLSQSLKFSSAREDNKPTYACTLAPKSRKTVGASSLSSLRIYDMRRTV